MGFTGCEPFSQTNTILEVMETSRTLQNIASCLLLGLLLVDLAHSCKDTVESILVLGGALTHHVPSMDVNNCLIT